MSPRVDLADPATIPPLPVLIRRLKVLSFIAWWTTSPYSGMASIWPDQDIDGTHLVDQPVVDRGLRLVHHLSLPLLVMFGGHPDWPEGWWDAEEDLQPQTSLPPDSPLLAGLPPDAQRVVRDTGDSYWIGAALTWSDGAWKVHHPPDDDSWRFPGDHLVDPALASARLVETDLTKPIDVDLLADLFEGAALTRARLEALLPFPGFTDLGVYPNDDGHPTVDQQLWAAARQAAIEGLDRAADF